MMFLMVLPLPLVYVDDTTLFEIVDELATQAGGLNSDLNTFSEWADNGC